MLGAVENTTASLVGGAKGIWHLVDTALSVGFLAPLIAAIYRVVPKRKSRGETSSVVLLYGAEFSRVHAERYGSLAQHTAKRPSATGCHPWRFCQTVGTVVA